MRLQVLLAAYFVLTACGTTPTQQLDADKFYRRDMQVECNGVKFNGAGVCPRAGSYEIKLKSKGKMDLLTVSTCHREFSSEDNGNEAKFTYSPSQGIEDVACSMKGEANEKKKGRHAWFFLDFPDVTAALPASLRCNGAFVSGPVSVCQSRAGLMQVISFSVAVEVSPDKGCEIGSAAGVQFEFPIALGECVYAFREKASPNRVHRLTTLGYESVLFRDE